MTKNHVIQRLTVEVNAPDQQTARQHQEALSHWFKSETFWRTVSARLDALVPDDVVLSISKLEIDVVGATEEAFQKDFIQAIVKQLEKAVLTKRASFVQSKQAYLHQITLFFLEKGYLPATVLKENAVLMRQFLEQQSTDFDTLFWQVFQKRILEQPQMLQRLIEHIGIDQAQTIFNKILQTDKPIAAWIATYISETLGQNASSRSKKVMEAAIWQLLLHNSPIEVLNRQTSFVKYLKDNDVKEEEAVSKKQRATAQKQSDEDTPSVLKPSENLDIQKDFKRTRIEEDAKTAIFIDNAGLVLLNPFLPQLFQALGWVEAKKWRDEATQHKAIRLLDYLVNGNAEIKAWEYD